MNVGCFTDPGSVPSSAVCLSNASDEEELRFCSYCNSFKPPRAHHCSQCKRCIIRMDHHCPWTNNCIGYRNMKYFVLFLGYVVAMCMFMLLMDFFRLLYILKHLEEEPRICCFCFFRIIHRHPLYSIHDESSFHFRWFCWLDA